jgi:capsular polysaccharide biosynthesis protein
MIGVGGVVFTTARPSYLASSVIYVQKESLLSSLTSIRNDGFSWVTPADATRDEFNELLETDAFIRAIVQQTDLENKLNEKEIDDLIDEMRDTIWVLTLGKNNLVMVGAAHEEPAITKQAVEATIDSFIQWKINGEREQSAAAQGFFAEQIAEDQKELEEAKDAMRLYLQDHLEPIRGNRPEIEQLEIANLQAAINLGDKRFSSDLEKEQNAILVTRQAESDVRQTYLVIDAATLPDEPSTGKKDALMSALIFVVVGVVLSVVGIIGGALIDGTFRFPLDIRHGLDLPVLAQVPNANLKSKPWWRFW